MAQIFKIYLISQVIMYAIVFVFSVVWLIVNRHEAFDIIRIMLNE